MFSFIHAVFLEYWYECFTSCLDVVIGSLEGSAVVEDDNDRMTFSREKVDQGCKRIDINSSWSSIITSLTGNSQWPICTKRALLRILLHSNLVECANGHNLYCLHDGVVCFMRVKYNWCKGIWVVMRALALLIDVVGKGTL